MHTAHRRSETAQQDSFATYLREIRSYELLTAEEEAALGARIRAGDKDAVEKLVCANLRFVISVAKRYQHRGVPMSDLINEGNLALLRAAERFDEMRGVRFLSYAVWWIRQSIIQSIGEAEQTVRVPQRHSGLTYRANRQANVLRHELVREPTRAELAERLEMSEREVDGLLPAGNVFLSLDAPLENRESGTLLELLSDNDGDAPDASVTDDSLADSVHDALATINQREANVIRWYFGLDGAEPMTLEDIGIQMGITRERVRQIRDRGLRRLKKSPCASQLAGFR